MLAGWLAGWPEIYQSRRFECVESDRSFHPLNLQVLANSVNASVNVHVDTETRIMIMETRVSLVR